MKWYKHVSTSLDDPFICELIYQFGSDAYLVFFGTLEIYSREFSPEIGWKFDGNLRYFRQKFQLSNSKIKKILSAIHKWEVIIDDDKISIFIPKFKELIDNYTRNEKMNTDNKLASPLQETCTPIKNKEIRLKNKEKDNTPEGVFVLPSWIPEETWKAYLEVRNKKRAAKTNYALNLIIKKLEKFKPHSIEVLNQSITNGWTDMYPLKENNNASTNQGFKANTYRKNNNDRPSSLSADDNAELERIAAEYYDAKKKAAVHNAS